jgi:hypothetical protein
VEGKGKILWLFYSRETRGEEQVSVRLVRVWGRSSARRRRGLEHHHLSRCRGRPRSGAVQREGEKVRCDKVFLSRGGLARRE